MSLRPTSSGSQLNWSNPMQWQPPSMNYFAGSPSEGGGGSSGQPPSAPASAPTPGGSGSDSVAGGGYWLNAGPFNWRARQVSMAGAQRAAASMNLGSPSPMLVDPITAMLQSRANSPAPRMSLLQRRRAIEQRQRDLMRQLLGI